VADHLARPELYVPLSVRFITGGTGTKLLEQFGRDGPLVWAAFLAACKLNRPAGEIVYASDSEGWALLGLAGYEPEFTLDAFFTFTGRIKKTRRTRSGRVSYVVCTAWERWTKAEKREKERRRKSSIRAQSERDMKRTDDGTAEGQKADLEVELEVEEEVDKEQPPQPEPVVEVPSTDIDFGTNGAGAEAFSKNQEGESNMQRQLREQLEARTAAGDPDTPIIKDELHYTIPPPIPEPLPERLVPTPTIQDIR